MRVLTSLPQDDLRKTAAAAQAAEAAGYDGALTMENKNDPFLAHAIAAVSTERMQLGTSVAIAFPRSPMVVANASWDLQIASRGRFVLGIGPQIRPHNERRFSVPWTAPAPRPAPSPAPRATLATSRARATRPRARARSFRATSSRPTSSRTAPSRRRRTSCASGS